LVEALSRVLHFPKNPPQCGKLSKKFLPNNVTNKLTSNSFSPKGILNFEEKIGEEL
jgi:hypothetical protein